ncbi:MAG: hypothetical protein AMJ69_02625 [Gammaproteobacteria bacterium SG8_47]|nr:MAG: hypothetical protein AMJ69_02625 [Gammaproteobacteria bacterium SG8_47]
MADERDDNALLEALQRLYSQLVSLVLGQRMSYASKERGGATPHDIGRSLTEYVEQVSRTSTKQRKPAPEGAHPGPQAAKPISPSEAHRIDIPQALTTTPSDGLSRHFKATRTGSALQPHVGDQLKKRVWDHIHEAVRIAHDGDAKTAKLHVEIANSALKEAAQHLPEDDYNAFAADVAAKIQEFVAPTAAP